MISSWDLQRSLIFGGQQPLELSEFQKGYQNGIRIPKNLWFDTLHYLLSLISYFDLWRSLMSGGQKTYDFIPHMTFSLISYFELWRSLILWGQMLPGLSEVKMESELLKTFDLIPHMTYFHWIYISTSRSFGGYDHQDHLRSKRSI